MSAVASIWIFQLSPARRRADQRAVGAALQACASGSRRLKHRRDGRRRARVRDDSRRHVGQGHLRQRELRAERVERLVEHVALVAAARRDQRVLDRVDAAEVEDAGQRERHLLACPGHAVRRQLGLRRRVEVGEECRGVALRERGHHQLAERRDIRDRRRAGAGLDDRVQRRAAGRRHGEHAWTHRILDLDAEAAVGEGRRAAAAGRAFHVDDRAGDRRADRGGAADRGCRCACDRGRVRLHERDVSATAAGGERGGGNHGHEKLLCHCVPVLRFDVGL